MRINVSYLSGNLSKVASFWRGFCSPKGYILVLEETRESHLDCKKVQPVHSEDQPWDFFGRTDAEAETPVLWPPHAKS